MLLFPKNLSLSLFWLYFSLFYKTMGCWQIQWERWLIVGWQFRRTILPLLLGFRWRTIVALSHFHSLGCWSSMQFLPRLFSIGSFPLSPSNSLCSNWTALASVILSLCFVSLIVFFFFFLEVCSVSKKIDECVRCALDCFGS